MCVKVNPGQFLLVCESGSFEAPCRLASAFVHLCKRNYIPLEVPFQCCKTSLENVFCFSIVTIVMISFILDHVLFFFFCSENIKEEQTNDKQQTKQTLNKIYHDTM